MEVSDSVPLNAKSPMEVTLAGIVRVVNAVPLNELFPIVVTLAGMTIEVSDVAP